MVFGVLMLLHAVVSLGSLFAGYSTSVIEGEKTSLLETVTKMVSSVLLWPGSLVQRWANFENQVEWLVFILNSMLWAFVLTGAFVAFQKSNIGEAD